MIQADFREAFALMDQTIARLRNTEPVMAAAAKLGEKSIKERIQQTKTAPGGQPWAEWSPITAAHRARRGTAAGGLLLDTGALLNSIHGVAMPMGVEVSPGVDYAKFLNEGTRKMPARPFMGWDNDTVHGVEALFQAWINGGK